MPCTRAYGDGGILRGVLGGRGARGAGDAIAASAAAEARRTEEEMDRAARKGGILSR